MAQNDHELHSYKPEDLVWVYCAICGAKVEHTFKEYEEYMLHLHSIAFRCKRCTDPKHLIGGMCLWSEPIESRTDGVPSQNPFIVRHCVKYDKLVMTVNCLENSESHELSPTKKKCPYWKNYLDENLTPEELQRVKNKWDISGQCEKKQNHLVTNTVCNQCVVEPKKPLEPVKEEDLKEYLCPTCQGKIYCRPSQYYEGMECDDCDESEPMQEERAREKIQENGIPAKEVPKPKIMKKEVVQRKLM